MNTLFLNSTAISNINIIENIYSSVLTSIPIKCGKVFNADYKSVDKPKIGNTIQRIHLTLNLSPVVVSYICKYEDQSGSIGIRCRADHLSINLVYVQHTSKKITTIIIENKKPKSVSKWNTESLQLLCSSIESRIMTMIRKVRNNDRATVPGEQDFKIPHDINQWLFIEDLNYVESYKDLTMSPFFRY
jgi:hypothetical protein